MKILVDARFYGLENAGLGRYTINLLDELQKIDRENKYFILLRKKYFDSLEFTDNFEKILADAPHYSLREQIEIPKIIKKINPDIVHFLHFNVPINFNGKFVVTIHDMTMHEQSIRATSLFLPKYFIKHLVYRRVFRHAVLKSQEIIVPSEFVKDELVKNFKIEENKVAVTYEGLGLLNSNLKNRSFGPRKGVASREFFGNLNSSEKLYFLYVGNAYPHKNLQIAIDAANDLQVNFFIVSKKNKFTDRLKLGKYAKVLGFVEDEKLQELYKNSTGYIFPSLSEGFGLPGLEAMQDETLLLASDISVFNEIYKNNFIKFDPKNVESIKTAMQRVFGLGDGERRERIAAARKFVGKYSWEKMAKETVEIYNSLG